LPRRSTARNLRTTLHLHSLSDIATIVELETKEGAIIIAQDEIACLDDMSLEGDIPDDVSEKEDDKEKALFSES
jgi:hypothetical protein